MPAPRPLSQPRARWSTAAVSAVGALGIVIAAVAASGEGSLDAQVPWLNLAAVASVVAGSAHAGFLVSTRRSVSLRLAASLEQIADRGERFAVAVPSGAGGELVTWGDHVWIHRSSCVVASGHGTRPAAPDEGRAPCPVCLPGGV